MAEILLRVYIYIVVYAMIFLGFSLDIPGPASVTV